MSANLSLEDFDLSLGSVEIWAYNSNWKIGRTKLGLMSFGKAEAALGFNSKIIGFKASASMWTPSFNFNIFNTNITIGADVGSIGAKVIWESGKGLNVGASFGAGGYINFRIIN